jgi:glycosyltransferase involved in cell wall biosynthesis
MTEPRAASRTQSRPAISVVMPTFNSAATVVEALHSITAQQYENLEILVIDDGSTDSTVQLVAAVCPQARVFRQKNSGAAVARNRGLREASGDLVAFLDADDAWFAGKLAAQVDALGSRPDVGFVFTEWLVAEITPDWGTPAVAAMQSGWPRADEIDPALSGWLYSALLFDVVVHTSTLVLRRDLVRKTGFFDESLIRGQDYDYWLRMSRIAPGVKLRRPFSLYRQHPDNATRKPQTRNYAHEILASAVRRWGTSGPDGSTIDPALLRAALSRSCRNFAWLHAHHGSAGLSLEYAARAVAQDLRDPRNLWASFKIAARAASRAVTGQRRQTRSSQAMS